jgi:hypothetical protein
VHISNLLVEPPQGCQISSSSQRLAFPTLEHHQQFSSDISVTIPTCSGHQAEPASFSTLWSSEAANSESPATDSRNETPTLLCHSFAQHVAPVDVRKASGSPQRSLQERQSSGHEGRHKRYSCDECTRTYPHRKNLREHKQTKHRQVRYFCDVEGCKQSLAHKKNLSRHKAGKHGP